MFSFLLMSIMEITHLAAEIYKFLLMMLFYRNLFRERATSMYFLCNSFQITDSPLVYIHYTSYSITIIQMCSPTWPS